MRNMVHCYSIWSITDSENWIAGEVDCVGVERRVSPFPFVSLVYERGQFVECEEGQGMKE